MELIFCNTVGVPPLTSFEALTIILIVTKFIQDTAYLQLRMEIIDI